MSDEMKLILLKTFFFSPAKNIMDFIALIMLVGIMSRCLCHLGIKKRSLSW